MTASGTMAVAAILSLALGMAVAAEAPPTGAARAAWVAGKRGTSSDERRRQFAAGIAAARARLSVDPEDPEGLLWLAANLGAEALERGKLSALQVLPQMERLLVRLDQRHPQYDHGAGARTLGVLYHRAPALISIGSSRKARQYFERALTVAPGYPPTLILAADFFDDDGDEERARTLARAYLAAPASEAEHPDAPEWRKIAARIVGSDR